MSEIRNTFELACEQAAKKGLRVVVAGPRELLVDIDDGRDLEAFSAVFQILQEILRVEGHGSAICKSSPSPSGAAGHRHITVTLPRDVKDEKERILLQALLGSDRIREALNLKRLSMGETENVSLFFEKEEIAFEPK